MAAHLSRRKVQKNTRLPFACVTAAAVDAEEPKSLPNPVETDEDLHGHNVRVYMKAGKIRRFLPGQLSDTAPTIEKASAYSRKMRDTNVPRISVPLGMS